MKRLKYIQEKKEYIRLRKIRNMDLQIKKVKYLFQKNKMKQECLQKILKQKKKIFFDKYIPVKKAGKWGIYLIENGKSTRIVDPELAALRI